MESKNELKEIDIKKRTWYYFGDIMRDTDVYFGDILLDEKSYKTYQNILIYGISYKTFMGLTLLHIKFDRVDEFIKIYDGILQELEWIRIVLYLLKKY